jgi:S1-C subfamily serine protease
VVDGGPADGAGLRAGDLVVALAGAPVEDVPTLQRLLVAEHIAAPVEITVVREDRLLALTVVPAELES